MSGAASAENSGQGKPADQVTDRRALVAIDLGAESCRVSLLRWTNAGAEIQLVHRFPNHAAERADGLHWDLACILDGLDTGLLKCAEMATEGIRSIAVDGWAVDYVRLDDAGKPMGEPFCYRDERTVVSEAALHERLTAESMRELTGLQISRINTVYQMASETEELKNRPWLNLPEYVLYRLGGRPVSELTNATHTQLVGLDGRWAGEIFEALEQPVALAPEIVAPGTDLGQVQGGLAELPAFVGTRLIAPACHDTASAIAAIPDHGDDWAYISSGTWSLVGTVLDAPLNTAMSKAENFTNLGGVDGTYLFHKNLNGMWLLRQCLESWSAAGTDLAIPELVTRASAVGSRGYVLDVDDEELLLPGHMPERINAQLRRRGLEELKTGVEDAPAMASFLFYSLASRYADVLAKVAEMSGRRFRKLYIMGGGSQNEFLNRLTAESTGLEVRRAGTECSTLGNFAVQLATLERTESARPACVWADRLSGLAV